MGKEEKINRRTCLSSMGSISLGGLGMTSIATAAAEETEPIQELSGREAQQVLEAAKKNKDFLAIKSALSSEGYDPTLKSAVAYQVTPFGQSKSQSFRCAIFEYAPQDKQSIEIGVPVDSNSPQPAKATITETGKDNSFVRLVEYAVESESGIQTHNSQSDGISTDSKTISTGETTVVKHSADMSSNAVSTDAVSPNSISDSVQNNIPDEKCATGDNMPCWGCKDVVSAVNVVSCGTAVWLICGAIGVSSAGMGGLACGIVVGLVCWAMHHYETNNPTEVCKMVCACP